MTGNFLSGWGNLVPARVSSRARVARARRPLPGLRSAGKFPQGKFGPPPTCPVTRRDVLLSLVWSAAWRLAVVVVVGVWVSRWVAIGLVLLWLAWRASTAGRPRRPGELALVQRVLARWRR